MELVRGDRIAELIRAAHADREMWLRLFHCPEKVLAGLDLSEDEARAVRLGDMSRVDLDDEMLELARKVFTEYPTTDGVDSMDVSYLQFAPDEVRDLCV
jgi:hypothetical protein